MIRRAPLPVEVAGFAHSAQDRDRILAMTLASRSIPNAALIAVAHNALTKREF